MNRWSGLRATLRMARRDAMRNRGRSVLVVVMIALPVLALTGADVLARTMQLSTTEKLAMNLGRSDARVMILGGQVTQTPTPVSLVFRTVAAVAPGLPSTGAGGGARRDGTLGALAAAGLGAAALAALARRKEALAAHEAVRQDDDSR